MEVTNVDKKSLLASIEGDMQGLKNKIHELREISSNLFDFLHSGNSVERKEDQAERPRGGSRLDELRAQIGDCMDFCEDISKHLSHCIEIVK